jgi:hypothetical protein
VSLLKVREGNYKKKHSGCRWNLLAERAAFLLYVLLKHVVTNGREEPGGSHSIINELGRDMCSSQPGEGAQSCP